MVTKHQHYMYMFGLQPKWIVEDIAKNKYEIFKEILTVEHVKSVRYFYCIAGCKNFCTYVLVYNKELLKQASDPKVKFPCVLTPMQKMLTMDDTSYLGLSNISDFLSQSFIPFSKVEHMDKLFEDVASTKDILSQSSSEIPPTKLQKLEEKFESCRATINECKVDKYNIQEEDTRNKLLLQKLASRIKKYGFIIATSKIKGFSIPVTEFGGSKNDHCLIHENSFYKMEKIACGVVLSANHDVQRYEVEEGNAIGGVIEMKNDGFAIDQTVAEMLRTAGDIALSLKIWLQLKLEVMVSCFLSQ